MNARDVRERVTPGAHVQVTIFYSDGVVLVTNARAILQDKTYAMANITSVSMERQPAARGTGITMALMGAAMVLMSASLEEWRVAIAGLILIALGVLLALAAKDTYVVRLSSASGEIDAFSSKDREYIDDIINALNESIVRRG